MLLLALAALTAAPASAQTPTPNEINAIAKELWCPLCNGVRLDNCELQACIQMREVIAEKLTAGAGKEEIKAYFVTQYGDVVLGAPSSEGFQHCRLDPARRSWAGRGRLARLFCHHQPQEGDAASRRRQKPDANRFSKMNTCGASKMN